MANFQNVDLMSVGEHCALQDCKRLDFLPYTCGHCKKKFCQEHYGVGNHKCLQFESKDRIIPPCPLCGKLVTLSANESINDQVERHIRSGCQALTVEKRKKNKCSQTNCKKSSLVPLYCQKCHGRMQKQRQIALLKWLQTQSIVVIRGHDHALSIRHRHPGDHTCIASIPTTIAVH